jgi:hypothetical protein
MSYKYEDVIDANQPNWRAIVKGYLDKGEQVVVYNLQPEQMNDCKALAVEHDFTNTVEDKGAFLEEIKQRYPDVQPEILGFVHRDLDKRIHN